MNLNSLNKFLNKNPKLLSKYISVSMTVIGTVLKPINAVMKHALVVQGIDPATDPGERQRKALLAALDKDLNKLHSKDFDDDYDFSWAKKALGVTNDKLVDLHLTRESFKKLTNLNDMQDKPILFEVQPAPVMKETRLYATTEEKEVKVDEPSRPTKFVVQPDYKPMPQFNTPSFKEAVETLKKYAAILAKEDLDEEERGETQEKLNTAGHHVLELQREKHKEKLEEEKKDAAEYNLSRKLPKLIDTYRKGSFKRVDKKKE